MFGDVTTLLHGVDEPRDTAGRKIGGQRKIANAQFVVRRLGEVHEDDVLRDLTPEKLQQFQASQGQLSQALGRLMVVSEQYPQLKATENFRDLQVQLEGTENRIKVSRDAFNASVKDYNIKVSNFPAVIFAGMFHFKEKPSFQADADAQKAPKIGDGKF